ncbi:restin-like 2 isoform 4-like protein [Camelus ferus]|nr:restin-like 2 isoform 4-like protein [Camelus ferus]
MCYLLYPQPDSTGDIEQGPRPPGVCFFTGIVKTRPHRHRVMPSDIPESQQLQLDHFPMCVPTPVNHSSSKFWPHFISQSNSCMHMGCSKKHEKSACILDNGLGSSFSFLNKGNQILKRGCNVNDRDGLTDMTLLHYTCKSGAHGIDVDATCSDFNFGTALHIAAYNLCASTVKCLLEHGANPAFRNDKGQIPADVVPDPVEMPLEMADAAATAKEIKQMLLDAVPLSCDLSKPLLPNYDRVTSKAMLTSLGLKLGDRVVIAGQKVGTLRFCGTTEFASGQWAGIELDEPEGKNNGSVGKVQYFKCAPKYATLLGSISSSSSTSSLEHKQGHPKKLIARGGYWYGIELEKPHGKNDGSVGGVQYFSCSPRYGIFAPPSRVQSSNEMGTVRYVGPTDFAAGIWLGLELRSAKGKNDGAVGEKRYFTCKPNHGVLVRPSRVTYRGINGSKLVDLSILINKYEHPQHLCELLEPDGEWTVVHINTMLIPRAYSKFSETS